MIFDLVITYMMDRYVTIRMARKSKLVTLLKFVMNISEQIENLPLLISSMKALKIE